MWEISEIRKEQAKRWARRKTDIYGARKAINQLLRYKTIGEVMQYECRSVGKYIFK